MLAAVLLLSLLAFTSGKLLRRPSDQTDWRTDQDYKWFESKLDHFDMQDTRPLWQRYWINEQYWSAENGGGPIFLYLCGEWTCSNQRNDSYVSHLAKKHGAILLVHEHRYYGMSQPAFPDWSTENLKWLNTDQALADVAFFADNMTQVIAEKYGVPQKRVFTFGGSYPGALVSWFRDKYSHISAGSWASSGVVDAIEDFHQFDETVTEALMKNGDGCNHRVRKLIEYTDGEFAAGRGYPIKQIFNATEMRDDEFFWFYSDVIAETVQYGERVELCKRVADLREDYAAMNQMINDWQVGKTMGRDDYWSVALQNTTIDYGKNGRQWSYQYCSELGYLQTPAQKYPPLKNDGLDLKFWRSYCGRIFDEPTYPDTHHWNLRYGGRNPAVSKVIYMNGDEDPWKKSSILESSNVNIHTFQLICNDCAHCVDLREPVEAIHGEVAAARREAEVILADWIHSEKALELSNVSIANREVASAKEMIKTSY